MDDAENFWETRQCLDAPPSPSTISILPFQKGEVRREGKQEVMPTKPTVLGLIAVAHEALLLDGSRTVVIAMDVAHAELPLPSP